MGWAAFWNRDALPSRYGEKKRLVLLIFAVSAVYFISHLYGYPSAPWNNYGLFDDAAWDIFIAQEKCFTGNAFEIIFWNPDIGMISRELLFHYYISILFRLFGYNLFVFNMALILLGYVTVLFTALLADAIFHNVFYAFAAGIMLNFLPVEFTQVFMGHRYAICGPVMMVSLFCLYRAVQLRSVPYGVAGGVFAGFAMESAIMGKQYLWALLAAAFLYAVAYRRQPETLKAALPVILGVLLGYAVTTAPLYAYIATNGERYNIRQANLTAEFFEQIRAEGLSAVWRRLERLWETLFAMHSWSRQFSDGFPILPWYLAVPAIAGSVAAFFKKHYVVVLMIAVPLAGNVVSESYDFRLLIAAPFMVLTAVYAFVWAVSHVPNRSDAAREQRTQKTMVLLLSLLVLAAPVDYLLQLAANPHSQRMLNHRDLAASRYIQDVVVGSKAPDFMMKWNEFNRPNANTDYDVFAATYTSYAHVHAYLQPYNSRYILRLFGDFPYIGQDIDEMRRQMARTLADYPITERDLVLVFEYNDKIAGILEDLNRVAPNAPERDSAVIDGDLITMVRYRIPAEDLPKFIEDAESVFGPTA